MTRRWPAIALLSMLLPAAAGAASSQTLTTPGYVVTLTGHCAEGEVGCDRMTYHGVSRATGASITLTGKTVMVRCGDGTTPCHVGDYEFHNGAVVYRVYPQGRLVVSRDGRVLVDQSGNWSY